jgi:hypothetical protein
MSEATRDYLAQAHENLAGAESALTQGRYNSCARSAYFAGFHAAIAALLPAGLVSPEPLSGWGHDWVLTDKRSGALGRKPLPLFRVLPVATCWPGGRTPDNRDDLFIGLSHPSKTETAGFKRDMNLPWWGVMVFSTAHNHLLVPAALDAPGAC